jgi:hypothetical protein
MGTPKLLDGVFFEVLVKLVIFLSEEKWRSLRDNGEQDDSGGEDVGNTGVVLSVTILFSDNLRSHGRLSSNIGCLRIVLGVLSETEVSDLEVKFVIQEQVLGFKISVDIPVVMDKCETV